MIYAHGFLLAMHAQVCSISYQRYRRERSSKSKGDVATLMHELFILGNYACGVYHVTKIAVMFYA